jgi:hypothetical protein
MLLSVLQGNRQAPRVVPLAIDRHRRTYGRACTRAWFPACSESGTVRTAACPWAEERRIRRSGLLAWPAARAVWSIHSSAWESRRLIALGRPGFDGLGRRGPPARWRERLAAGARQHIGQAVASPAAEVLGRAPAVAAIVEVGTVVALLGHGKAPVQFSAEIRERDSIHGCTLSLSRQPQNLRADLGG